LRKWFPGEVNVEPEIRAEIERRITRGERISTSVEMPLTAECKKVLTRAAETSERLGHRIVESEYMLIGILPEASLAAQILTARGVKPEPIQEQLAKAPSASDQSSASASGSLTLNCFLAGLKWLNSEELISFFAINAEFVDASGNDGTVKTFGRGSKRCSLPTRRETQATLSNRR
jgi:ATP-dependent Clp protease ATP-binding subunit ClpA